jgi:dTDP-4-amino-4,6-dideoxygalactose transaminase
MAIPSIAEDLEVKNEKLYNMELKPVNYNVVAEFESRIAEFFGAPYAVAVDSCTHGVELSLAYTKAQRIIVPTRTYISIPFLAHKLKIKLKWRSSAWQDYYLLTDNVIDAAVLWKRNSYIPNTFMCISFQYQKHLSLGRGGVILAPDMVSYMELKKMSYDGRIPGIPWRDQNISSYGYHYYMTIETAQLGLDKLDEAINTPPRKWTVEDWPDLTQQMDIFKK